MEREFVVLLMVHVNFQGDKLGLNSQNIQQSVIDVRERQWTRAGTG